MARERKKKAPKARSTSARKPVKGSSKKKLLPASKKLKKSSPKPKLKPKPKVAKRAPRISLTRRSPQSVRFSASRSALPSAYAIPKEVAAETYRPALEVDRRLPQNYGDNKLTLLVRDPWWIFSFWEITHERAEAVIAAMPWGERDARVTVLRIYNLTNTAFDKPVSFFDIELRAMADSWYVDVGVPNHAWGAEVGFRLPDGRFWPLVRSNVVHTPRFGFSEVLDEEWMIPDELFWKLVGTFGAKELGAVSSQFSLKKST